MAKPNKAKFDIYATITNTIVEALENGTQPWECPWAESSLLPANITTDKAYRGVNILLLWAAAIGEGFESSKWLTFNQAKKAGGQVQKGAKSSMVTFFKFAKKEDENGKEKMIPVLRYYRVFNAEQVDGLNFPEPELLSDEERIQNIEDTIGTFEAKIKHGGHRACYQPDLDIVTLPPFESFKTREGYYATAFHELIHWTGHTSRMDRDLTGRFGDESYAMEELIAELGAAFACARLGMTYRTQHADYIQSWIKVLKADKYAIFTTTQHATPACDYLLVLDQDGTEEGKSAA